MKTFVIVDMQNDFVSGSLGSEAAKAIVPKVVRLVEEAEQAGEKVIFTRDTHDAHYLESFEGKNLPCEHCIEGTYGWELIDELEPYAKGALILDKPTFGSMKLSECIEPDTNEVVICGLCTDICVISNALLLRAAFPNTPISLVASASAGSTPKAHKAALDVARSCQIEVLD